MAILAACAAATIYSHRLLRSYTVPKPGPEEGRASISVIAAVHDEEPRVGTLIASLLAQDHPDFEAIVVDDRSTDGTAEAARRAIGGDPRCRVLSVRERPAGWQGRLYAQGIGARAARGDWLIFLSGDQELRSRSFLRSMVSCYERSGSAAVSVVGPFTGRGWWHRWWFRPMLNNPIFWGVIFGIQELWPDSPWLIGALGIHRARWHEAGGARAAATCAAGGFDDWGWCRVFEKQRLRARTVYHPDLADASNWTDFRTFWQGFARWQAGIFTYRRGGWIAALVLLALVSFILVDQGLALASLLRGDGAPAASLIFAAIAPTIGIGYVLWSGERWWFALVFHLVGLLLVVSILGGAWARLRNQVGWRDEVMYVVARPPVEGEKADASELGASGSA